MDQEAALLKINHQNVLSGIQISKSEPENNVNFMVTELAEGGELFDQICYGAAFEEPMARLYFSQLLSGIKACHESGIAHRDLKPENILLDKNMVLKITDFGLSGPLSEQLSSKVGTKSYCAPEIYTKTTYEGGPADIFSAGVILFFMLTQGLPFK